MVIAAAALDFFRAVVSLLTLMLVVIARMIGSLRCTFDPNADIRDEGGAERDRVDAWED